MFVFSNLAISVDGKIGTADRGFFPLGTSNDHRNMLKLRKQADAILIGASTLRTYRKASFAPQGAKHPINVILSSRLSGLSARWPFFGNDSVRRILITTTAAPAARRKLFAKHAELIVLPARGAIAPRILRELSRRGIRRLLVEGGGGVMWEFVSRNLIDEYHVTLTPRILGGRDAPTLVDGAGFPAARAARLKLRSCRRIGDELYLVYRKTGVTSRRD